MPKQFANSRRAAWHTMFEPKSVYGPEFVGRKHNLQSLFPRQTAPSFAVLHDTLHEQAIGKVLPYYGYSLFAILLHCQILVLMSETRRYVSALCVRLRRRPKKQKEQSNRQLASMKAVVVTLSC
jgi:hypothetical protein